MGQIPAVKAKDRFGVNAHIKSMSPEVNDFQTMVRDPK